MGKILRKAQARLKWSVGTNMPGYMPDNEPSEFTAWRDAHGYLLGELERDSEESDDSEEAENLKETMRRAKSAKRFSEFGETVNGRHYWLTRL